MGDFFNVDNKFFQGLGKIIDVICLSAFWFFLCIPIVTAGAATTVRVEIQIRSVAMDYWAELDSQMCYKKDAGQLEA